MPVIALGHLIESSMILAWILNWLSSLSKSRRNIFVHSYWLLATSCNIILFHFFECKDKLIKNRLFHILDFADRIELSNTYFLTEMSGLVIRNIKNGKESTSLPLGTILDRRNISGSSSRQSDRFSSWNRWNRVRSHQFEWNSHLYCALERSKSIFEVIRHSLRHNQVIFTYKNRYHNLRVFPNF